MYNLDFLYLFLEEYIHILLHLDYISLQIPIHIPNYSHHLKQHIQYYFHLFYMVLHLLIIVLLHFQVLFHLHYFHHPILFLQQVQLLVDEDVLKGEYFGCHPCINTSSLKIKTEDILKKFLKHTGHGYTVVKL